jgi:hypothetical protein
MSSRLEINELLRWIALPQYFAMQWAVTSGSSLRLFPDSTRDTRHDSWKYGCYSFLLHCMSLLDAAGTIGQCKLRARRSMLSVMEWLFGRLTFVTFDRIPATFIITGFLVGIDELALQLEEPFSVLPQHAMTANSIGKVAAESVDWRKTDYERMIDAANNGTFQ